MRARYSRRHRGSVNRRQYGLAGLLACAACGRHLTGHVGRYRHQDACAPFRAAAPRRVQRDGETIDPRVRGESYKVEVQEEAVGLAFRHVAVSSTLRASTVAAATRPEPGGGDVLARTRISRERDQAALRFPKDNDLGRLEATMPRLDARGRVYGRPTVAHSDRRRGADVPGVAAGPVGRDVGRRAARDRGGRVRADRRPGGNRLHVHLDRSREGPRVGCSLRGWGPINLDWPVWSGREG